MVEGKCGVREAAAEGLGWVEGRMRVSRRERGGRGRSQMRSNGTKPYLSACGVYGGTGGDPAEVGDDNCARGGRAGGRVGGGHQTGVRSRLRGRR